MLIFIGLNHTATQESHCRVIDEIDPIWCTTCPRLRSSTVVYAYTYIHTYIHILVCLNAYCIYVYIGWFEYIHLCINTFWYFSIWIHTYTHERTLPGIAFCGCRISATSSESARPTARRPSSRRGRWRRPNWRRRTSSTNNGYLYTYIHIYTDIFTYIHILYIHTYIHTVCTRVSFNTIYVTGRKSEIDYEARVLFTYPSYPTRTNILSNCMQPTTYQSIQP